MDESVTPSPPDPRSPDQLLPDGAPEDLCRLMAYWITKAGERPMPGFPEIDPVEIPWALSRLYVVRVIDGGADFRYRLVGEDIRERHGIPMAGKRPVDLFPAATAAAILERWRRIVTEPAACYTASEHPTRGGWRMRARRVQLPLGQKPGSVDHLLAMTIFEEPRMVPEEVAPSGMLDVRWLSLR